MHRFKKMGNKNRDILSAHIHFQFHARAHCYIMIQAPFIFYSLICFFNHSHEKKKVPIHASFRLCPCIVGRLKPALPQCRNLNRAIFPKTMANFQCTNCISFFPPTANWKEKPGASGLRPAIYLICLSSTNHETAGWVETADLCAGLTGRKQVNGKGRSHIRASHR